MTHETIIALFRTPVDAAAAVETLERRGMAPDSISLVVNEQGAQSLRKTEGSHLAEGAAIGGGFGGAAGALAAGLTSVGAISTGGVGVLAAGPLIAAMAGAGAGVAGGSLLGAMVGATVPEKEIPDYEDALRLGSALVAIDCASQEQRSTAREVFKTCEATRITRP